MQVVVDSLLTSYSKVGNGAHVALFLHGWADSGKTFKSLADQFIKENSQYTAILLDLPGFGATQTPDVAWTLTDYALFVTAFLNKTKLNATIIVGHSNGGAIAIHGLSTNVLQSKGLVLIGSAGIRNKTPKKEAMRFAAKPAKALLKLTPRATQKNVRSRLYNAIGSDYLVAEHLQETFKNVVAYDVRQEARSIAIPVSLIYGSDDTATPPEYGTEFSKLIRDSQITVIPESTHFVHQEQVYKVSSIMTNFVTEQIQ